MAAAPDATFGIVRVPPAEPPLVGLLPSLSGDYLIDDTGVDAGYGVTRWAGGVAYQPEAVCTSGGVTDPCNPNKSAIQSNPSVVKAMPAVVWAGDKCSTLGWEARDYRGRAQRALIASESKQIAAELWKGTQAQASSWPNRYLANPLSDTLTNGPTNVSDALGILEQGLADCSNGQRGMIHCTRQLATRWAELGNTFRTAGNLIVTYMGSIIVPDAGYDGSGPNGQPAVTGSQWAYGTLMVTVRRSPIVVLPDTFEEATIRTTNDIEWRAERLAVASFPLCCHVAAEVDLPAVLVGGAS